MSEATTSQIPTIVAAVMATLAALGGGTTFVQRQDSVSLEHELGEARKMCRASLQVHTELASHLGTQLKEERRISENYQLYNAALMDRMAEAGIDIPSMRPYLGDP